MFAPALDLALLSVVTGTVSVTLTHSAITRPIRHKMIGWPLMLDELANCPYCMAHWVALGLAVMLGGSVVTVLLNAAVLTGGGGFFAGLLLKVSLFREAENEILRELLAEAKQELENRP